MVFLLRVCVNFVFMSERTKLERGTGSPSFIRTVILLRQRPSALLLMLASTIERFNLSSSEVVAAKTPLRSGVRI